MNGNLNGVNFSQLHDKIDEISLSVIFKNIREINISDLRIRDAFKQFVSNVETNGFVSISDIICSAHSLLRKQNTNYNIGDTIFCFDGITNEKMILKNSIVGLFKLFALETGVSLDINAIGGSISAAELQSYLIVPAKKEEKFTKLAEKNGIKLKKAGYLLSENSILITKGNEVIEKIDKSDIDEDNEAISVSLNAEHFSAFSEGYSSLLSYVLCDCISENNILCFGLCDDISMILARAIGYFAAALKVNSVHDKIKFRADNRAHTVVPRPTIADGDYFYLLKLRNDCFGLPDIGHFNQLRFYLSEYKKRGIIKNVLPYRENIISTLNRLCSENIEFDAINSFSDKCFGVVVSVSRGESLNGIKLGYFKSV